MSDSHNSLILTPLKTVTPERLQKAVAGLAEGSYAVTTTRLEDGEIRAFVNNGEGGDYGVTLTEAGTSCSCKEARYRGVTCKHAVAVAFHVLRIPPQDIPVSVAPAVHLSWTDGQLLCGFPSTAKVWPYPWPTALESWPECCAECKATYSQGRPASLALVQTRPPWSPVER